MFGEILDKLLKDNKLSPAKLSRETGISEALIGQWRCGRQLPGYKNIVRLCDYFDVSADYILGRTDNLK